MWPSDVEDKLPDDVEEEEGVFHRFPLHHLLYQLAELLQQRLLLNASVPNGEDGEDDVPEEGCKEKSVTMIIIDCKLLKAASEKKLAVNQIGDPKGKQYSPVED